MKEPTPMKELLPLLRQYWHYDRFRPLQEEIITSVLNDRDTLALLPTGGGKSLCYQLPALARPGLCLVISPLVSLMKDQTDQLRKKGITAFYLHGAMNRKEVSQTLQVAGSSNCKLLYVSPERLESELFLEWLPSLPIGMIAVDEAHCVSQWGYDFRPTYLRIAALRKELSSIAMLALTASATPDVLDDISRKLELREAAVFRGSFTRPNLSFRLLHLKKEGASERIAGILQKVPGSSIIYCKTRKETSQIAEWLCQRGISATAYHAGLPGEERAKRQDDWLKDRIRVIVSTNAFGMGIDKSAVRSVIHTGAPDSPEAYYQEAGRAGRDGAKAFALLLFQETDIRTLESLADRRFPPAEEVRAVYQHLMNYLQLAEGSGREASYDFDLASFASRFGLEGSQVLHVIRVLEQTGLLSFQQSFYVPSRVRFTTGKENLYDFEKEFPALREVIEALLRNYEGIFDQGATIREGKLAYLTGKEASRVKMELAQLQAYHLIEYQPQKDSPQLYFFRDRPPAEALYIDPVDYRERKERYSKRVRAMIEYLRIGDGNQAGEKDETRGNVGEEITAECRSRWLARYFGDTGAENCGICDSCLRRGGE
jgi:ATP-dependent DNA helicase RecQ